MNKESGRPGGLSSDDGAASVSTLRASIPDANYDDAQLIADTADWLGIAPDDVLHDAVAYAERAFPAFANTQLPDDYAKWPESIKHGMVRCIAEAQRHGTPFMLPAAVAALWRPWRGFQFDDAQGIEARRAETGTGSVHESPVAESDAP